MTTTTSKSRTPRARPPAGGKRVDLDEKGISAKDPFKGSQYLRAWGSYLGQWDPDKISINVLLKMLKHPAVALAEHIIWAPLVNAEWEIECSDENRRKFMKAVIDRIYLKLMLFSLPAIGLGFASFTKQWGTEVPFDDEGNSLWPQSLINEGILPVVPVDLKQLDPQTVEPIIEKDEFKGIHQKGYGDIEPLYSMWITHHRHKVWGSLWGWPLLTNVYQWWWSSGFRQGLLNRHIEDRVAPSAVVDFPPGYIEDPDTGERIWNRDSAMETGKAVRAGETVGMPSEQYLDEQGRPAGRKWDIRFLQGGENVEAFITLEDASDLRILMGMLIPPQAVLQVRGGIGSQSVAETLGEMFWASQRIRKQELDQQFTDFVVEPIERLNFGKGGPHCRLVTKRFRREDQKIVDEILKLLANRQDLDPFEIFNVAEMIARVGLPGGPMESPLKTAPEAPEQTPEV